MKRSEILFLACVLAAAGAFGGRVLVDAARAAGWGAGGGVVTSGQPRDVDMEKLRRLIREGGLSDREALYWSEREAAAPAEGVFTASRKFQVMATDAEVTVVLSRSRKEAEALGAAEEALRRVDALMSDFDPESEIGRLNAAGAGPVRLSEPVRRVLASVRRYHGLTNGAFDVTCRPLVELWRRGGRVPGAEELRAAREGSNWRLLELSASGAVKKGAGVRVDLGGIAKGYAVDRAVEELRIAGAAGALVNAGGDLAVFGRPPEGGAWRVAVRHPFKPGASCAVLSISSGAVCTSGNYEKYVEIGGKRYGHVIDPRSGLPAEGTCSATVAAPSAAAADAWATALSVLGTAGLELLASEPGAEAMVVGGSAEAPKVEMTPGFRALLASGPGF